MQCLGSWQTADGHCFSVIMSLFCINTIPDPTKLSVMPMEFKVLRIIIHYLLKYNQDGRLIPVSSGVYYNLKREPINSGSSWSNQHHCNAVLNFYMGSLTLYKTLPDASSNLIAACHWSKCWIPHYICVCCLYVLLHLTHFTFTARNVFLSIFAFYLFPPLDFTKTDTINFPFQ